jgi:hypothetical protein
LGVANFRPFDVPLMMRIVTEVNPKQKVYQITLQSFFSCDPDENPANIFSNTVGIEKIPFGDRK